MSLTAKQESNSVVEWLDFLRTPTEQPDALRSSITGDYSFTRTQSLDEALNLAEDGWPEGINLINRLSARLSDELVKTLHVPEVMYDVTGDLLDIGRFVRGEPEDFMSLVPAEIEQYPKVLSMVVNICASAGVSPESLMHKGAAIVALVDALEQHGKRVGIDCIAVFESSGAGADRVEVWVRIKESNAPVQLANLVFLLAHPSSLRRLMFCAAEHLDIEIRNRWGFYTYGGYGQVGEVPASERDDMDIYVPGMDLRHGVWDEHEAATWVLAELSNQGIYAEREEV